MENTEKCTDSSVINNDVLSMLDFEKKMYLDVVDCDALLITAKGLNENIVVLNVLRTYMNPSNLVLIINSSDIEEKCYNNKLSLPPIPNTGTEREKMYLSGGVHFLSTRILVVDLLKKRVPIEHVTGIIVLRAHTVLESCQEAFALRLFRQSNKTGFIKAFSHSPQNFTFGYSHVEKVMKALFITELFLWPRFHGLISQCLKISQPTVIELHVPLSNKTTLMQTCILDIMNYTTKELKKINRTLDLQEITVENCITRKFHKILQSQLDCIWHQLSTRTKELIQDLKIMRNLIINLIHHDAISFYNLLGKYRTPEYAKVNSGWILLDSAEQLFKYAKIRVFNSQQEFCPEIPPKWKQLSEILTVEIPGNEKRIKKSTSKNIKILILCNDSKTCTQLNEYLTMNCHKSLYLAAIRNDIQIAAVSKEYEIFKTSTNSESTSKQSQSSSISTLEENLISNNIEDNGCDDDNKSNFMLTMSQTNTDESNLNESIFEPFTQMEGMDLTQRDIEEPIIYIQTFKNNSGGILLEDTLHTLEPSYVVMYHSDITATRQIELYEARRNSREIPLVVFFLIHAQTTEEQSYLTSLRREKQSFELLIDAKSTMVIPSYQDGKVDIPLVSEDTSVSDANTRKAGGQEIDNAVKERPSIIVDMREFRSDLPALLHKKGIHIDPVTILIGDYILTPEICVERKSLSDLIGSLNSGRLYTQCTQMCRHYVRPMLLIEFDQNRPFQLQGHYVLSNDISGTDIREKLQLLTIHFPRLKLVWSPSPYATAELFFELKQGRAQPDSKTALALGDDSSTDILAVDRYNAGIHDFVLKLPGVNSKNIARIMNTGTSMDNIIKLSRKEIDELAGNRLDGEMLWNILHNTHKASEASNQPKAIYKNRYGKPMRGKR